MLNCLRIPCCVSVLCLAVLLSPGPAACGPLSGVFEEFDELVAEEIDEGLWYRMVDETGRTIMETGRRLAVGDQYLAGDNRLYEVIRVEDRTGYVRRLGTVTPASRKQPALTRRGGHASGTLPVQAQPNMRIAVYHTHNDESYVPTSGTPNVKGRGDVHVVGEVFRKTLEDRGIEVFHAEDIHLPHDRAAYRRSRNTAVRVLAEEPDAVFDVHRDAAPWDAYAQQVDGAWLAQIMFVVGRQNPHFQVNRSFAFDLKDYVDTVYPGLIRGVFIANGNYNQDLHPLTLLLEVGAHENTRRAAVEGIARFADAVGLYLYGSAPGMPAPAQQRDQAPAWRNIVLVLLVVGAAAGGFYWLNNPQAADRLRERLRDLRHTADARVRRYLDSRRPR